ncbi:MAG TPA: hypothetical protein VHB97_12010 [Polyangia bacterium]|nr:hypothetical protein [Polyangia bacterium]
MLSLVGAPLAAAQPAEATATPVPSVRKNRRLEILIARISVPGDETAM